MLGRIGGYVLQIGTFPFCFNLDLITDLVRGEGPSYSVCSLDDAGSVWVQFS